MPTKRPAPVRSDDQTTFTWSLSKELKAGLLILADKEGRKLSNLLTNRLETQTHTELKSKGIILTDALVEETLKEHAEKAARGRPERGGR